MRTSPRKRSSAGFVVGDGFGQEFERDRLVERQIVGAVDLAHAALAEHGDDAVAAAEQFAGSEAALRARELEDMRLVRAAVAAGRAIRHGLRGERIDRDGRAAGCAETAGGLRCRSWSTGPSTIVYDGLESKISGAARDEYFLRAWRWRFARRARDRWAA